MYPPFVTQKVEPKCAATDAVGVSRQTINAKSIESGSQEDLMRLGGY